jgi:hypothetical protein
MGLQPIPFDRSGTCPSRFAILRYLLTASKDYLVILAGEGTRTPDLLITNQLLYQLSYASIWHISMPHDQKKNIPQLYAICQLHLLNSIFFKGWIIPLFIP